MSKSKYNPSRNNPNDGKCFNSQPWPGGFEPVTTEQVKAALAKTEKLIKDTRQQLTDAN